MKFAFYSCMSGVPWGGSEELWFLAARRLQEEGHQVAVNYQGWPKIPAKLRQLKEHGAELAFRPIRKQGPPAPRISLFPRRDASTQVVASAGRWLKQVRPDMVLVIASFHPDQIVTAPYCQRMQIPYAINLQSASSSVFIRGNRVDLYRDAYSRAAQTFFVSEENQRKMELNIGAALSNAVIVDNPCKSKRDAPATWPADDDVLRLACVGRIHFQSKGQDLIADVLRQSKWKDRQIKVTVYGENQGNQRQLEDLIAHHSLESKIEIAGFSNDPQDIWAQNHGLILPSRYEGAALVVPEAMMAYRPVITTDMGRNREFIEDNVSGFIAPAATTELLDEALERAWQARDNFREIGLQAGHAIREKLSIDPAGDFAERLVSIAQGQLGQTPNSQPMTTSSTS